MVLREVLPQNFSYVPFSPVRKTALTHWSQATGTFGTRSSSRQRRFAISLWTEDLSSLSPFFPAPWLRQPRRRPSERSLVEMQFCLFPLFFFPFSCANRIPQGGGTFLLTGAFARD